ncbi:MAG: flagellar hook capping FlgD N-terminal domain-containing protein [Pseudomonadota bacterium]
MTSISEIATSALTPTAESSASDSSELGQDEFLRLMLEQIRHQDPFKPADNGEFITQMAQFSQVSSTDSMRTSLEKFVENQSTAQLLNAASLIGRTAMVDSNLGSLADDGEIAVEFTLPESTEALTATVTDGSGQVVHTVDLGRMGSGTHAYSWDGETIGGAKASPGSYTINIQYQDATGESVAAPVMMSMNVESVNLGVDGSGLTMTTSDGREVLISDVRKFL